MKKKKLFGLNIKQAELLSDKGMDAGNYLLTGVLLASGFSENKNVLNVLTALVIYAIMILICKSA